MASPLSKRFPREIRENAGKYAGIFLLIAVVIALTSGFLTAAHSIGVIMDGMPDRYLIEDARFTTEDEATASQLDALRDAADDAGGAQVHENFSFDADLLAPESGRSCTLRTYAHRTDIDLAAYAEGEAPATEGEIAIDRVFAANNGIAIGDEVRLFDRTFTVSGIMTLPDYQALFQNNSDFTVNTLSFGVAEVAQEGFDALAESGHVPAYTYSVRFADRALSLAERTDAEGDMMRALSLAGATVTEALDASANQSIGYASDDVEGDSVMWTTLLYLIIAIMAFAFVVLTSSTIEAESAVIGTLLASGYRKRTLVAHYAALPTLTGIVAAAVGNVCGFTLLCAPMRDLYYGSYSLPPYYATWNWGIFLETTMVPVALLALITLIGLAHAMRRTPLQFLRHESGKRSGARGVALPERLGFAARFRLRVFLRNLGNFATLFVGIAFSSMLLLFSFAVLPTMTHYADNLASSVVAAHEYTLKAPVELEGGRNAAHPVNGASNSRESIDQAERYAVRTLEYDRGQGLGTEAITVYGIARDSRYWDGLPLDDGHAAFGCGLVDKFGFVAGQNVALYDKYEDESFDFTFDGENATWGTKSDMALYLSLDDFNERFGNDAGYFNAYASDEELAIDAAYLASELTPADMDAIGEQFVGMMNDMIGMLVGLSVFIFFVFMYLLTKSIIDRSARTVSYLKVFGYRDREIDALYVRSMTSTVALSLIVCQPLIIAALTAIFRSMLLSYNGNIEIYVPAGAIAATILIGFATYLVIALLHVRRIKHVPLALALKAQD